MVVYWAMEGERIYISGSLYMSQEQHGEEGVLPDRIFTHEDAKMLRPRNIFRKKFSKTNGKDDSYSVTDSISDETFADAEFKKPLSNCRKEKVVHRIHCDGIQDIQVVEVGDDEESDENTAIPVLKKSRIDKLCEKLRANSSLRKSEDTKQPSQPQDLVLSQKNSNSLNKENESNKTLNKENESNKTLNQENETNKTLNQENETNKTLNQENETNKTLNQENETNKTLNQENETNKTLNQENETNKTLNQENETNKTLNQENETNKTLNQENESNKTLNQENKSNKTLNQEIESSKILNHESKAVQNLVTPENRTSPSPENDSLKLVPHPLDKENATANIPIESDLVKKTHEKTSISAEETIKISEKIDTVEIKNNSGDSSEIAENLSVKKSSSEKVDEPKDEFSSPAAVVPRSTNHNLRELSVVLFDCQVASRETCSALLFEQQMLKCDQDCRMLAIQKDKHKAPLSPKVPKLVLPNLSLLRSQQKRDRKRPYLQSPLLASTSPASRRPSTKSSHASKSSPWTVTAKVSPFHRNQLRTLRAESSPPNPLSLLKNSPYHLHHHLQQQHHQQQQQQQQNQLAHLRNTAPSSLSLPVHKMSKESKKTYPLLTQALTSMASLNHSSASQLRQELYLTSNSRNAAALGRRSLHSSPLSSVSPHFMPGGGQDRMCVKPEPSDERDLRSSIFSSQFASFIDQVNRPVHTTADFTEAYAHQTNQFPKWLPMQNHLLSYD